MFLRCVVENFGETSLAVCAGLEVGRYTPPDEEVNEMLIFLSMKE